MNLTVNDLANRWRCSRTQIYKQVKAGKIPHFLIGSKGIRFRLKDIEEFETCASNSTEANGAPTGGMTKGSLSDARLVRITERRENEGSKIFSPYGWLVAPTQTES